MSVSGSSDPPLCAVWVTPGEEKSNIQAKNMVELTPSESNIYTIYIIHRDLRTLWRTTQEQLRHVFSFLYFWRHISPSSPLLALLTAPPPPQHPPVASSKYLLVPPSFVCKHMGSDKVAASTSNTTQSSNWTIIFIIQQLPMKGLKSHLVWAHLHPLHDSEKYKQPRQTSLHLLQRKTFPDIFQPRPLTCNAAGLTPADSAASTCRLRQGGFQGSAPCVIIPVESYGEWWFWSCRNTFLHIKHYTNSSNWTIIFII